MSQPVFRSYEEFKNYYFPKDDTPELDIGKPEESARRLVDWALKKEGLKRSQNETILPRRLRNLV